MLSSILYIESSTEKSRRKCMRMSNILPNNDNNFMYFQPHVALRPYIAYYSITTSSADIAHISPVFIPDLGGAIIISQYHDRFDVRLWGPFNRISHIDPGAPVAQKKYFIEFHPGGLSRLIYNNSQELLNQKLYMEDVNIAIKHSLIALVEQHALCQNQLISQFDMYFLDLLVVRTDTLIRGRHILKILQCVSKEDTITAIEKEVHYSQRQMNRYLNTVVGVSSKNYLRVKRINLAVQMLKQRQCSIEEVAFELGYYDSAHFIHDFTKIMNKTPTMYRENMSDFYSETTKRL